MTAPTVPETQRGIPAASMLKSMGMMLLPMPCAEVNAYPCQAPDTKKGPLSVYMPLLAAVPAAPAAGAVAVEPAVELAPPVPAVLPPVAAAVAPAIPDGVVPGRPEDPAVLAVVAPCIEAVVPAAVAPDCVVSAGASAAGLLEQAAALAITLVRHIEYSRFSIVSPTRTTAQAVHPPVQASVLVLVRRYAVIGSPLAARES
jgi:hypothetical protein